MIFEIAGTTHVGLIRNNNEDNLLFTEISAGLWLLAVADGVGGNNFGEVASQTAVDEFIALVESGKLLEARDPALRELLLEMAVQRAHLSIANKARDNRDYAGMACALTAVIVDEHAGCLAQVGDTRLYHWSLGVGLTQLSQDQTVAVQLVERGQITEAEAETHPDRNVLAQALGIESVGGALKTAMLSFEWSVGDRLLLCSDGLSNMASNEQMAAILSASNSPEQAVDRLIDAALAGGGRDNITVVVATVVSS